jgi:hypothetical protein
VPDQPIEHCCKRECHLKLAAYLPALRHRARQACVNAADKFAFFETIIVKYASDKVMSGCIEGVKVCRSYIIQAVGGSSTIIATIRESPKARTAGGKHR